MAEPAALDRIPLVVDGHADTLGVLYYSGGELTGPAPERQIDHAKLTAGGVGLQVMACCPVWHDPIPGHRPAFASAVFGMLDGYFRAVEEGAPFVTVTSRESLDGLASARLAGDRKVGVLLAIEGGEGLEGQLSLLRTFFRLGVRLVTLTHNPRNELADGVAEEGTTGGGLTQFGRAVVAEMNRLGMVIDVSHLGPAGFWQVISESRAPIVASHSNAKALCPHRRNLTDEQAKAIAVKGGLIGVTFCPQFLCDSPDDKHPVPTSLEDVIRHIDYLVNLVGPHAVGVGSDFDGIDHVPAGLENASHHPSVAEGLRRLGYGEEDLAAILGGNWLRVFRSVLR